ncbi:MAG: BON domain-containing protein [Alphaproteobacteria bacterium]|nr:BON domain-containing protein [Alphaproteobacteria bacterium]
MLFTAALTRPARILAIIGTAWLGAAACTPIGVTVGVGAAAATAGQTEKGFIQAVDDTRIRAELNAAFLGANADLYQRVSFTTEEGRVLLTGRVPTPDDRITATRLTWNIGGVREVINEIQIQDESGLTDRGRDVWIAARLRGQLLVDDQISSINYSIDVLNRVVYVLGIARSDAELARVLGHARDQSYVKAVVNYVRVGT